MQFVGKVQCALPMLLRGNSGVVGLLDQDQNMAFAPSANSTIGTNHDDT